MMLKFSLVFAAIAFAGCAKGHEFKSRRSDHFHCAKPNKSRVVCVLRNSAFVTHFVFAR